MANRVSEAEVREIISTPQTDLLPFITAANIVVTRVLGSVQPPINTLTLKEIERWVSAHFVASRDQQISSEKIGDAEVRYATPYQGVDFVGLKSTTYGRQAMVLDPTGNLSNLNKLPVSFGAMGPTR